jgi:hypothetical protein
MSIDTITLINKTPISILPFTGDIQYIIYEHVYGSDAYRKHKNQLTTVLIELVDRLSVKIDLESNIVGIHQFLNRLSVLGFVETYRIIYIDQPDEMHLDGIYPDGVLFPDAEHTCAVVNIIWRDDIIGPTDISIQPDETYGSIYMTPEFFPPTEDEMQFLMELDPDQMYIRTHTNINDLAGDIIRHLQAN